MLELRHMAKLLRSLNFLFIEHVCVDFYRTTGIFLIFPHEVEKRWEEAENSSIDNFQANDFMVRKKREFYLKIHFSSLLLMLLPSSEFYRIKLIPFCRLSLLCPPAKLDSTKESERKWRWQWSFFAVKKRWGWLVEVVDR